MKTKHFKHWLLLTILALANLVSQAVEVNGINYELSSDNTACLVRKDGGYEGDIDIPSTITVGDNTYTVTSIGDEAFNGSWLVKSVTIPNSVTSIGMSAFYGCKNMQNITIPNSVTNIGEWAFYNCLNFTSLTLPSSLTRIEAYTFSSCSNLEEINIPNSVLYICDGAFKSCSSLTGITIPNSVTIIGEYTFQSCSSLTNVTIPNSVTSIGQSAFSGCSSLTNVTIPNSVTSIGQYAFEYCSSLTNVTIPNSVTSIGGAAFHGCSSLSSVTLPNSVKTIGEAAFLDCTNLTSITIPNAITAIESFSFQNCTSLKNVTIPNTVKRIGQNAFDNCSMLTSVTIPNSVTSIESSTFSRCTKLDSVTIPNSVTTIGNYAFYGCSSLTSITIPNSVTRIEEYAFSSCSKLTSVTIPNSVTNIGEYAFQNYSRLKIYSQITEPSNCFVRDNSFSYGGCLLFVPEGTREQYRAADGWKKFPRIGEKIVDIDFPTTIDGLVYDYATDDLDELYVHEAENKEITSASIPDNIAGLRVTGIGSQAFANCSRLTNVTIPNSVTIINSGAFNGCSKITTITIPESVTKIHDNAFYRCTRLTSVTIPNSVTYIGNQAFDSGQDLKTIYSLITNPSNCIIDGAFNFYSRDDGYLFVPEGTRELYRAAEGWKNFSKIGYNVGVDFPTTIDGIIYKYATNDLDDLTVSGTESKEITTANILDHIAGLSVTSIADKAFKDCRNLTSVTIPESVKRIGGQAFLMCYSLASISIPNSVKSIGGSAFSSTGLTSIIIPNSVTSIGDYAFSSCTNLTSVTLPDSVTSIAYATFNGCTSLTSITIPNTVTSIGQYAFQFCSSLTSVTIPNAVTSIESNAFERCEGLTSITIPNSVTRISSSAFTISNLKKVYSQITNPANCYLDDSFLYSNCQLFVPEGTRELYRAAEGWKNFPQIGEKIVDVNFPTTIDGLIYDYANDDLDELIVTGTESKEITSANIPDYIAGLSVTKIAVSAFSGCSKLTSITIPNSVTSIGGWAFNECSNLASVAIPNSVTSIGNYAFYGCSNLASVTIPSSVTSIGSSAFGISGIKIIHSQITEPSNCTLGNNIVSHYESCQLFVPEGTRELYRAAEGWKNFQKIGYKVVDVDFPTTIDGIVYDYANDDLDELQVSGTESKKITSVNTLESIAGLSVTKIAVSAFYDCSNLTSVTIPNSVTSIGQYAFQSCLSLTSVTIPSSVTSIGEYAFQNCSSLIKIYSQITEPSNCTIGNYTVSNYSRVKLFVPEGTRDLYRAAEGWKKFQKIGYKVVDVDFPTTIDGIVYDYENYDLDELRVSGPENKEITSANIQGEIAGLSVTSIGGFVFDFCSNLTNVTIPNSVTSIGEFAFRGCSRLTSVTIPNSVKNIGKNAFYGIENFRINISSLEAWCNIDFTDNIISTGGKLYINGEQINDLVIPSTIQQIKPFAFWGFALSSITIPNSVKSIGAYAFANCNASKIQLGDSIEAIDDYAFYGYNSILNKLPNGLKSIGEGAFYNITNKVINLPSSVETIKGSAFSDRLAAMIVGSDTPCKIPTNAFGNENTIVYVPRGSYQAYANADVWSNYIIQEQGVEFVLDKTKGENIYDAVANVGVPGADYGKLIIRDLPITQDEFTYINTTFTNLMELDLSDADVTEIANNAFDGKYLLRDIVLPKKLTRIGNYAFQNCSSLENAIVIPDGVTQIGVSAFNNCSLIPSVKFNDGLASVGAYSFRNCSSLSDTLVAPSSLATIGEYAFYGCNKIKGIDLSKVANPADFGPYAFYGCSSATFVSLPDRLTEINHNIFEGCSNVETVHFPKRLKTISNYAFYRCSKLGEVDVEGSKLVEIGDGAFAYCSSLKNVNTYRTRLVNIGSQAFADCRNLVTVSLPDCFDGYANLGTQAFQNCRSLKNVSSPGATPAVCVGATQSTSPFVGVSSNSVSFLIQDDAETHNKYLLSNFWGTFISKLTHIGMNVSLNDGSDSSKAPRKLASLSEVIDDDEEEDSIFVRGTVKFFQGDLIASQPSAAPGMNMAPGEVQYEALAAVPGNSQLYVPTNQKVSFVIKPVEGFKIGTVLYNGTDVTDQVVNNVFVTDGLAADATLHVSFVEIDNIAVETVTLNKTALSLPIGATEQLVAQILPEDATNKKVMWKTENKNVATVDENGVVTATGEGTTTITATAMDNGLTATCAVSVTKDNYLEVPSAVEATILSDVNLEVSLVNKNAIYGMQFDVYLPEGVTLNTDGIIYSEEMQSMTSITGTSDDGKAVRVQSYCNIGNPTAIAANETSRVIVTLPLSIGNIVGGNIDVTIKNIRFASEGNGVSKYLAPAVTTTLSINGYEMGDVNQDEKINVTDVLSISYRTINRPITGVFNERLADLNYDEDIDVNDLVLEVFLVTDHITPNGIMKAPRLSDDTQDAFAINGFNYFTAQQQRNVGLSLDASRNYTACQMDVTLSDGLEFACDNDGMPVVALDENLAATHTIVGNVVDGTLKLTVFSMSNEVMEHVDGDMIAIGIKAGDSGVSYGKMRVENVKFVETDGNNAINVNGADSEAMMETSGINDITIDGVKVWSADCMLHVLADKQCKLSLVSLNGIRRTLDIKPGMNTFDVDGAGVYMINGHKLIIK